MLVYQRVTHGNRERFGLISRSTSCMLHFGGLGPDHIRWTMDHWIGLKGKFTGKPWKPWYFMGKTMVSGFNFPYQSTEWDFGEAHFHAHPFFVFFCQLASPGVFLGPFHRHFSSFYDHFPQLTWQKIGHYSPMRTCAQALRSFSANHPGLTYCIAGVTIWRVALKST